MSSDVIKYPEITKNTSTPTKPPPNPGTPKWNNNTATTATARSPSMSLRCCIDSILLLGGRWNVGNNRFNTVTYAISTGAGGEDVHAVCLNGVDDINGNISWIKN